jgi:hypothetical protein
VKIEVGKVLALSVHEVTAVDSSLTSSPMSAEPLGDWIRISTGITKSTVDTRAMKVAFNLYIS